MENLISRFLASSHIDPLYFVTCIVDVVSIYLWTRLKEALPDSERSLYKAVIIVAIVLTAGALCKFFGVVKDWRELESIWRS
jgi:hypothetical protein